MDESLQDAAHLNPALGLRAIRGSLADPAMFLTQLRAILRAAAHGQANLLIPMLVHASEIRQTLALIDHARVRLDNRGVVYGPVKLLGMGLGLRSFSMHPAQILAVKQEVLRSDTTKSRHTPEHIW